MIALTRRYTFYSRHRLHSARLDEARNREVYGKCNNPNGHGHNYGVEITVAGCPDPDTGFILRREELDAAVSRALEERWQYQDLNRTLGAGFITTGENLARAIHEAVARELPSGVVLLRVKLHETRKNRFVYFADARDGPSEAARRHPNLL